MADSKSAATPTNNNQQSNICIPSITCPYFQQNQQRYSKYPEQQTLNIILGKVMAAKIEIELQWTTKVYNLLSLVLMVRIS